MEKHICKVEDAALFYAWLQERGGLALWKARDRNDPTASWSTPVEQGDGTPFQQPHWKCGEKPDLIYTDPNDIIVSVDKETERFYVQLQGVGRAKVCTKECSTRIKEAILRAGPNSFYQFDYETQEAVIFASTECKTLREWADANLPKICEPSK